MNIAKYDPITSRRVKAGKAILIRMSDKWVVYTQDQNTFGPKYVRWYNSERDAWADYRRRS